jgi:proteasome lid subunit RPN8/RPN11
MPLTIPQPLYDQLRAHGEETYPHECCGIMLGKADDDEPHRPPAHPRRQHPHRLRPQPLHIAPQELIAAQREGRKQGLDIVGFYHSHPDHPAQWSPTDFAEAHWFGCAYVITADGEKGQGRHHQQLPAHRHRRRRQGLRLTFSFKNESAFCTTHSLSRAG